MKLPGDIQRGNASANRSGDPDLLARFPLPLSPPIMDPADPVHSPMNPQEVHAFFHDDENSLSDGSAVSSSSVHIQPPATIDIALTAPPPDQIVQALRFNSRLRQNTLYFRPYLRRWQWSVGGLSYRFWYTKSCLWQAFSRFCAVIATVGYAHRVHTLGEDGVGKHPTF